MRKYDLATMLEEIKKDEGRKEPAKKQVLTQEQIRALARARRKPAPEKPPEQ